MCPVPGDIPVPPSAEQPLLCQSPQCVCGGQSQEKFVTVRARALSGHQGKLRHKNLHMCHAMVTDKAVQLSSTALASPESPQAPRYPNYVCLPGQLSADGQIRRVKPEHLPILQPSCSPSLLHPQLEKQNSPQAGARAFFGYLGTKRTGMLRLTSKGQLVFILQGSWRPSSSSPSPPLLTLRRRLDAACADGSATTLALLVDSGLKGQAPAVLLPSSSPTRPSEGSGLKTPFCY